MIEVRHRGAVHLPGADLWLDPHYSKPLAFVSHAHSDHTGRHERTIATPTTLHLMEARMGTLHGEKISLPFDELRDFEKFRMRLLPAGHVLGSAQCFVETEQGSLLYTGDFKLRQGASAETTAHTHAETLIMETTYGLPRYVFPPFEEVMRQVLKFCIESMEEGATPILLGYSLGKSQEILANLCGAGLRVMLHSTIAKLIPVYESEGIVFPEHTPWDTKTAAGHVLICPPTSAGSKSMALVKKRRVAAITGWALDPGAIHRMRCDAAFPLSDHAGYDDLLRHVENVAPKRVLTLHGFASEFAADLRARGIEAWALTGPNQLDLAIPIPRPQAPAKPSAAQPATTGFLRFCSVGDEIAALTGKQAKITLVSAYFQDLDEVDLRLAALWLSGSAFSSTNPTPHQAGRAIIRAALIKASGMPEAEYRPLARGINESGLTAETVMATRHGSANPALSEVATLLEDLRAARSGVAKIEILTRFFQDTPPVAAKFLVKILSGDLRIGLKEGLLEECIADAFEADPGEVREANMFCGDLGLVAVMAQNRRLHEHTMRLFQPVKCMLASPEPDAAAVRARFAHADTLWIEPKFDGIRAQIHTDTKRTEIFTRDLKVVTSSFPEIARAASELGREAILDAEILAWRDGRPLPFHSLQKRLGRQEADLFFENAIPVACIVFDIMQLDGTSLLKDPLHRRRKLLHGLALPAPLRHAEILHADSAEEIDAHFRDIRSAGHEGLLIKDSTSHYQPGRRGLAWIKLKKRLATLDVVVTAVEYGHGKRRGVLSDYTFAVRDEKTGALATIGKAYTGLTDLEIATLTDEFLASALSQTGNRIEVEPLVVLEIAFDSIRESPRHPSGLALRFPRITRIRRDKSPTDIDTIATARKLLA
jgi:DNA ligase-1